MTYPSTTRRTLFGGVAALTMAVTGCSKPSPTTGTPPRPPSAIPSTSPSPSAEPRTVDAAKAVAQREADAYSSGDWVGAWDLWTKAGKAAIPRTEYARLHTTCKTLTGPPLTVKSIRAEGDDKAVVIYERMGFSLSYTLMYEDGQWRFQPDDDSMADYAKGVDKVIAEKKAKGECG